MMLKSQIRKGPKTTWLAPSRRRLFKMELTLMCSAEKKFPLEILSEFLLTTRKLT
jgi:hypothetical protein